MFLENAQIHDDLNARAAGFCGGLLVNHALLQPDGGDFQSYGFVNDFRDKFRATKYIKDIDLFFDIRNRSERLFPRARL